MAKRNPPLPTRRTDMLSHAMGVRRTRELGAKKAGPLQQLPPLPTPAGDAHAEFLRKLTPHELKHYRRLLQAIMNLREEVSSRPVPPPTQ